MVTKYERSWQFDIDRSPSDNSTNQRLSQSLLWYIKAFLVGDEGGAGIALWTVLGSSDGTTGALDATDRWGSVFTPANLVRAAPGVAHSWITLQAPNPLGTFYLTIDYSGTLDNRATFVFSAVAPVGGSVTDRPTSTLEWTYEDQPLNDGSNDFHLFHAALSVTGDLTLLGSRTGDALFSFAFLIHRLEDVKPQDDFPTHTFVVFDNSAGVMYRTQLNGTSGFWKGLNAAGNTVVQAASMHGGVQGAGTIGLDTSRVPFEDLQTDATDNLYDDLPMYMYVHDDPNRSLRGRLADIRWCPWALSDGDSEPSAGAIRSMVVGDVWVVSDTTPTLV